MARLAMNTGCLLVGKPQFHGPVARSCDEEGFRNYCNLLLDGFKIRVFLNDAELIEYTAANPEEGWVRVIPPGNSLSARVTLTGYVEIRIERTSRSGRT
ncbi:hypothetical protein [Bradyrhizobium sp. I1.7.5]|uniref:hypothetical protein n=1 Tax=Bradyrhizobium sp. I1.7.5 TaxID=3156363 RepID=UPI00339A8255